MLQGTTDADEINIKLKYSNTCLGTTFHDHSESENDPWKVVARQVCILPRAY